MTPRRPRIVVTLGDPRGIGPEVAAAAMARPGLREAAELVAVGPEGVPLADGVDLVPVGRWEPAADDDGTEAGRLAGRAVERAVEMAVSGEADGLVTAPLSKAALAAAGWDVPGHTELLRDRTGVPEVTMMMVAERTPLAPPLDGPLRLALLTGHLPLRRVPDTLTSELAFRRARIAAGARRDGGGIRRPGLAVAGVNPPPAEGGRFGDEEERVLAPAAERLEAEGLARVDGIHPADTVFRRNLRGDVDAVAVPYHDVGLAVLKTLALERGVNVTAGLPFPRTSPDHGTAFDIAGRGRADPGSMIEAVRLCLRLCRADGEAAAGASAAGSSAAGERTAGATGGGRREGAER